SHSGPNHEKQKTERRTRLETIGRPDRAAAAPIGHRTHRLFASPAAQPPGRETPPPVFPYVAGTQYPAVHGAGAQGRAPARSPRRFALGPTQQNRPRGGGAA